MERERERERERFCFILWKMPMQVWAHLVQCCRGSPGAVGCCSLLFERWTCWCGDPLSLLPGTPHSLHQLLQPCYQSEMLTDCFCAEKVPGVEIECKSSVTSTAVLSSIITWFTTIRVKIKLMVFSPVECRFIVSVASAAVAMLSEREQSLIVSVVTVYSCGKIVSACRSSVTRPRAMWGRTCL